MRVLKFGGKSLSSVEKSQKIAKYIKKIYKNDKNLIIVVSAIGKTTDNLLSLSKEYGGENPPDYEVAKLLSTGETQSASLFSILLNKVGVPAKSLSAYDLNISSFGSYTNSRIAYINKQKILDCFKHNQVAVVAGFQGLNKNNEITLLGRGGSDTTAAAIAAIFDSPVEIYSDYNGIFYGDPQFLNYKKLKKANYDLMIKMAESGARVLDSKAIQIAKDFNINIISKGSTEPNKKGSLISAVESNFISVQTIDNLTQITIVFADDNKLKFIVNSVLFCKNNIKIYNLTTNNNKLTFLIESKFKTIFLSQISKKLNLLKNK